MAAVLRARVDAAGSPWLTGMDSGLGISDEKFAELGGQFSRWIP